MELGYFDDSLFEDDQKKRKDEDLNNYHPKICEPEWYTRTDTELREDEVTCFQYKGSLAYHRGDYTTAVSAFREALDKVPNNHVALKRSLTEDLCRSYLKQSCYDEAEVLALKHLADAQNFEQKSTSLILVSSVYRQQRRTQDELTALAQLITMHPNNPTLWMQLGDAYQTLCNFKDAQSRYIDVKESSCQNGPKVISGNAEPEGTSQAESSNVCLCDKPEADRSWFTSGMPTHYVIGMCLVRSRMLFRSTLLAQDSFIRDNNKTHIQKLTSRICELSLPSDLIDIFQQITPDERQDDSFYLTCLVSKDKPVETFMKEFESKWFPWSDSR